MMNLFRFLPNQLQAEFLKRFLDSLFRIAGQTISNQSDCPYLWMSQS